VLVARHAPLDKGAEVAREQHGYDNDGEAEDERRNREGEVADLPGVVDVVADRLAQTPEPLQDVLIALPQQRRCEPHTNRHLQTSPLLSNQTPKPPAPCLRGRAASSTSKSFGGGDRTRTCKPVRAAVFKTAALPIMLPLRDNYSMKNITRAVRDGKTRERVTVKTVT